MTTSVPREQNTPRVLTLEGSCVGHNVAGRWLIGELHPLHLLDTPHKLTCMAHKQTMILPIYIALWQDINCQNWACSDTPGYWPQKGGGCERHEKQHNKGPEGSAQTGKQKKLVQTSWHKEKQEVEC